MYLYFDCDGRRTRDYIDVVCSRGQYDYHSYPTEVTSYLIVLGQPRCVVALFSGYNYMNILLMLFE